jgi:hypothetical protein
MQGESLNLCRMVASRLEVGQVFGCTICQVALGRAQRSKGVSGENEGDGVQKAI